MGRYSFKIQATADDPNKVLIGQFLPMTLDQIWSGQDPLDYVCLDTENAWWKIMAFCPEEIDWDSVTRLEIMYDEFPFPCRGKWILCIHTNDGNDGTIQKITVSREDEEDFQRKVFEYLTLPDILGLQETKKLHWVIKCGLGGSSNSDVN